MSTHFQRLMGLLFLVGVTVLFALAAQNVSAATLTVDDDGEAEYTTIQEAIDNATEGDTIRVWEGIYYENVLVNETMSLVGNGSEETTIDGGGNDDVVKISADWVNISGFMVTGSGDDSGIMVESDNNNIFENNCSNNYFGIHLSYSSNCIITNNTCENDSTGITLFRSSFCVMTNNTCSSNNHYGISLQSSSYCTIENNTCSSNGNGILFRSSDHNTITNNSANSNSCGIFFLDGNIYNTISNNTFDWNNLGIFCFFSSENNFFNNSFSNNVNVGINITGSRNINLINNTCMTNGEDGIVLSSSPAVVIENNIVSNNRNGIRLEDCGGGIIAHNNLIFSNVIYGINATCNNDDLINATNNWWGSNTGPCHPSENPDGQGDNVSNGVFFEPWIRVPNNNPSVSITSPANNSTVSGIITIKGTASDPDGNETVEKVVVSVNIGAWETATGTTSWTFEWNTSTLENGEYSLKFRDYDGTDFSEVKEIILNVQKSAPDNRPPSILIISPKDGDKVEGKITIKGSVSDENSTVENVEISFNSEEWNSINLNGTTSWEFEWNTKALDNRDYTIKVRSFDGTNYSQELSIIITVENDDDGEGDDDDDDDGGGFIPGFGAAAVVGSIGVALIFNKRKKED